MKKGAWAIVMAICTVSLLSGQTGSEWRAYGGDLRHQHYSPLSQVNAANFNSLEVAWRFKTDSLGPRPEFKLEGTPLMVNGVLYTTAGTRRAVIALDAATGELRWVHAEREGARAAASPRQLSGRGVAYWSDGRDERILYVTTGYRLVALDAKTGSRIGSFGRDGIVDLKEGAVFGKGQQIDLVTGEIGVHSTPSVTRDGVVMVGSSFLEGGTPKTHNNTKGLVRGFDVRTGKRLWTFNTIPRPGEFGNDTWLNESWAVTGNVGVWNQISVDEDLGLAYLPVETPTSDFYGGLRPGNNLFAESIVAIDYKTGQRKWHFQLVHHPIWNMDVAAAPMLVDVTVDGRPVRAVAAMGKQAMLYLFNRITGEPIFPIEERPVPQSDVPGEKTSPTQPFPTKPPPYDHQGVTLDNLIDFTPELRAEALKIAARYKTGPIFTPPPVSKTEGPIAGFRSSGGTNWPGGSFDPDTHIAYIPSYTSMPILGLLPPPNKEFSDLPYVSGNVLTGVRYISGPGENVGADAPPRTGPGGPTATTNDGAVNANASPQGLPLLKPPYGRITAINLDRGEIVWQVAHGETPDSVRNNPALKGVNVPRTGQSGAVGALVTKTLVIVGDPLATTLPNRPRGAMLRAYDKATGREVGAVYMPAQQSGTPMTYELNGKQYIVVAISGGNYSGEYLAFALPSTQQRP
ncbi:MAG TPA: PQQ-binding-like beta-propeller repeat protein [Vicinamibacterales bacterium]|jgi:quinoprotein glucose dehydrogenase|nr:PQQ-binding-like beta-propeller repeat protein [Vicinamibacterales bacterium]